MTARTKKEALKIISQKLAGIPWAIFGGTAVEIVTNGQRMGNDIDIVVPSRFLYKAAKKFNAKIQIRNHKKGKVEILEGHYFTTIIDSYLIEVVGETGKMIINGREYFPTSENAEKELFKKIERRNYLGVEVFITPVEEIIVHKIAFDRSGEWRDREDVQLLFETQIIDKDKLILVLNRWEVPIEEQNMILDKLYQ